MGSTENVKNLKSRLAGLKRARRFIDWRENKSFAEELEGLLADRYASIHDPRSGVELVATFFECDSAVFNRCDDSNGRIGDVFRLPASGLFAHYAKACTDKAWLTGKILKIYAEDGYGVRIVLLKVAYEYLPEEYMRSLADRFWELAKGEEAYSHRARHWIIGVETLARQLKDARAGHEGRARGLCRRRLGLAPPA